MAEVISHPSTQAAIEAFLTKPTHALCLVGPRGAGKAYVAHHIATSLVDGNEPGSVKLIAPSPSSISIEQVRELQHFLKLKKPGSGPIKRVIIMESAEKMGDEAQNALLKTLEEPPADTVFILTTDGSASLRPTIYSRVQKIPVLPINLEQAKESFKTGGLTRAYHLSGGYVGLLSSLLNDSGHELVGAVANAKSILNASPYERLVQVDMYAKNKDGLHTLFYALERVIGAALANAPNSTQLKRLVNASRMVYEARIDVQKSANTKLLLTDLFLGL